MNQSDYSYLSAFFVFLNILSIRLPNSKWATPLVIETFKFNCVNSFYLLNDDCKVMSNIGKSIRYEMERLLTILFELFSFSEINEQD